MTPRGKFRRSLFMLLALSVLLLNNCSAPQPTFSAFVYGKVSAYVGDVTRSLTFPTVSSPSKEIESDIIEGQYVVRFDASSSVKQQLSLLGKVLDELRVQDEIYYLLETSIDISSLREKLSEIPGFLGIEPHSLMILSSITPNDPGFYYQWNLPLIRVPEAWSVTKGSDIITIAVIDSGVDLSHEDLQGILVPGYDFVENDNIPQDDRGHGTHVVGIIAALTNNNKGVAGVTWGQNVKIMPLKVFGNNATTTDFHVAKAFVYAVDHGAKIINASLGSPVPSDLLQAAVRYAYQNDVVMVCAAGNHK
jgi:serine protease